MRLNLSIRLETEAPNDDVAELDDVVSGCCSGITLTGRVVGMMLEEDEEEEEECCCEEKAMLWELGDA